MNLDSLGDVYLTVLDCFSQQWQDTYCLLYHDPSAEHQVSHLIHGVLQYDGDLAERMLIMWQNKVSSQSWKQLKF